jgi:hypothetical protein
MMRTALSNQELPRPTRPDLIGFTPTWAFRYRKQRATGCCERAPLPDSLKMFLPLRMVLLMSVELLFLLRFQVDNENRTVKLRNG